MYSESYITVLKEINFLAWAYSQENKTQDINIGEGKSKTIPNVGVVNIIQKNLETHIKAIEIVN